MTNRTDRAKQMEKLHRRGRELRRFFVVHVRYGGSNPWSFNTGDLYYMIKFCPLSEAQLHEHHRDPAWISDYQGMLNIREKWRVSMKKYHGDLPENYEWQISRVDSKREPLIEEGMAGYFQPETRLQQDSLYLPPPHHQPRTLPLPEAQEEQRGKDHDMPPPLQPARLPSLQHPTAFPLPPQVQDHHGGDYHPMSSAPQPTNIPLPLSETQRGGELDRPKPHIHLQNPQESGFLWTIGNGLLHGLGRMAIRVGDRVAEASKPGWQPGEFEYADPPDEAWGPLPPDAPPPSPDRAHSRPASPRTDRKHFRPTLPKEAGERQTKRMRLG